MKKEEKEDGYIDYMMKLKKEKARAWIVCGILATLVAVLISFIISNLLVL